MKTKQMASKLPNVWLFVGLALLAACSQSSRATEAKSSAAAASSTLPKPRSAIGTNLASLKDWSTERPFADLFKQSRAWISNSVAQWDDGRPLDLDAKGWVRSLKPGQRARSLVMWGVPIPAGNYVVTWKGTGTVDFWPQEAEPVASTPTKPGRAVVAADPKKDGFAITIVATDPKDPVRDIRVWAPGQEGKLFHPAFLESLKGYSTLRFMDWMETNESKVAQFAQRSVHDDARWSEKGVPLEVMVELCNTLNADMWLTVPDTWDDDGVRQAAKMVKAKLGPRQRVYVEHSNEVWNGIFPQAIRARDTGVRKRLAKDPFQAQLLHNATRSVEIFRIWEKVFSGPDRGRLVNTIGSMAVSPWASKVLVQAKGVAKHADALAIAPYFGNAFGAPENLEKSRLLGLDALFAGLDKEIADMDRLVSQHHAIARKAGLRLIAYEGGQHLVGVGPAVDDEPLSKLFDAANRDPRMKGAYLRALAAWKKGGGELFMHFTDTAAPNKFGRWGAREHLDQPRAAAPKWDALMTFAERTPVWW